MTVRVNFKYDMEFYMKTWSELNIKGTGFWEVDEEQLAEEFHDSEYDDFKEFLEFYFKDFSGLDLDDSIELTVNEDDFKKLENEMKYYEN